MRSSTTQNNIKDFNKFFDKSTNSGIPPTLNANVSPVFARGKLQTFKTILSYFILISSIGSGIAYFKLPEKTSELSSTDQAITIATSLSKNHAWKESEINLFLYHWGNLTELEKLNIKRSKLYLQFTSALSEQLDADNISDTDATPESNTHFELLQTVAFVTGYPVNNRKRRFPSIQTITKRPPANRHDTAAIEPSTATASANKDSHEIVKATTVAKKTGMNKVDRSNLTNKPTAIPGPATANQPKPTNNTVAMISKQEDKTAFADSPNELSYDDKQTFNAATKKESPTKPLQIASIRQPSRLSSTKNSRPSIAELDNVVNQYIDAFEKGNVNQLISLLSINIRTSKESNREELRKNLSQLFSTTSDRQLFIRNIKWSYQKDIVKGIGSMEQLIVPKDDSDILSTTGKVQIIAKRVNNKILITHLYNTQASIQDSAN